MALGSTEEKLTSLKNILFEMDSILVAYSGGVDSTFLAVVAHEVLGENALAVLAVSPVSPSKEKEQAELLANNIGFNLRVIETNEMDNPEFTENPENRCYYCKKELFQQLKRIALAVELKWIADGTNADDLQDYRPGIKAGAEAGVRSPLLEVDLTKEEIRMLSRQYGLPTWDRPASPCLASRIPYGTTITPETLNKIAEGEMYLHDLGIRQLRLRHHGNIARIEVDEQEMTVLLDNVSRKKIVEQLKKVGYRYVVLDLTGYRTGSLNPTWSSPS